MIFVTVGTSSFEFSRLLKEVDKIAKDIDEKIIVQRGNTSYEPRNCDAYGFVEEEDYERFMKNSRIIVTHAGAGSIITCLNYGKKPVIVPRRLKFNEHTDDHQIEIAEKFSEKYKLKYIENINELEKIIKTEDNEKFKFNKNPDKNLVKYLKNYIEDLST